MTVKFGNQAHTTLASGVTASGTSVEVTDNSLFPDVTASGDYMYVTLAKASGVSEVIKVTNQGGTGNKQWTVDRSISDSFAFTAGDRVELRVSSEVITDIQSEAVASSNGTAVAMAIALG